MHILLAAQPGLVRDGIARMVSELSPSIDVRCADDAANKKKKEAGAEKPADDKKEGMP